MAQIRVLLVDDIATVRHELAAVLPLVGDVLVVGEAADGAEALIQVEKLLPDVVLMDLAMPVMDGYTATRRMKQCFTSIRVVALSVHSYESARMAAQSAGADAFMEKGAPLKVLMLAIQQK